MYIFCLSSEGFLTINQTVDYMGITLIVKGLFWIAVFCGSFFRIVPMGAAAVSAITPHPENLMLPLLYRPLFENSQWLNWDLLGNYGFSLNPAYIIYCTSLYYIIMYIYLPEVTNGILCYHYLIAQKYKFLSYLIVFMCFSMKLRKICVGTYIYLNVRRTCTYSL